MGGGGGVSVGGGWRSVRGMKVVGVDGGWGGLL